MEKKILKKLVSMLTTIMILTADFSLLGSNLISYAASNAVTQNIEFSSYFKNEAGSKVDTQTQSIKSENLKLYAQIAVKNEGYFNGAIELQDSNFKIKNNILSDDIASIEGNKVNLKQINAGKTVEIELDIEPITSDTITSDMLAKVSTLKLTGTYMEQTYKGLAVELTKNITLNLQIDESANAELTTNIITNKVLSVNGTNKRVVQLLINSRLTENQYPIKQTTLKVNVPQLSEKDPEEIQVLSLGTKATNGKSDTPITNFKNENGVVTIELKNEPNENNEIKWNKNVYDEIVVTFIYSEDVDASRVETTTNSEITIYNSENKYTAKHIKGIENKELNNIITTQVEAGSADIYKGQLYENVKATEKKDVEYSTKTTLKITNTKTIDELIIHEGPDVFTTGNTEVATNTKYIRTEINKEKMLSILGQNGSIQIKNGQTTQTINKDTEANESGNIVINYENSSNEIEITTTKPQNAGILEIYHTKAITAENTLSTEQIKPITGLKITNTTKGTIGQQNVIEIPTEIVKELQETVTKAELTINKENLSTMIANNELSLGIKLITDGVQYDLYKNPKIEIKLPSAVESISLNNSDKLYAEGFTIDAKYNPNTKTIILTLKGEQTEYTTEATQIYLQLNLNVKLSRLAPSTTDKIVMTYTNENATLYDGGKTDAGVIEKTIGISSQSGLATLLSNNKIEDEETIYGTNNIVQDIANADAGKDIKFNIDLINNTGLKMSNVKIIGKLPTAGIKVDGEEVENTLTTKLKGITASNATIYYTENAKATTDLTNTANGWTTVFNGNAKLFLIQISEMNAESNYSAEYTVQLPNPLSKDQVSFTEYTVIYDTEKETSIVAKSRKIELQTATAIKMETSIKAEVGNDELKNGDTVKAGEVIKYTATVKNTGAQTIDYVQLKAEVPEGTVVVVPEENYAHSGISYYNERTDLVEVATTIPSLAPGETFTTSFEVRVKSDITSNKQISNKAIAICNDETIQSSEITNKIETSKIRVTIKKIVQDNFTIISGGTMEYLAFVENLSGEEITNLEMQIVSSNFKITHVSTADDYIFDNIPEKFSIKKIEANGNVFFKLEGNIMENTDEVSAIAIVSDSNGNTYRSNKCTDTAQKVDAKISLSSPQNKAYIRQGDTVEYNLIIENTGNIEEVVQIIDNIPEYLKVNAIYVNGELKLQSTETAKTDTYIKNLSNKILYDIAIPASGQAQMTIITRVDNITSDIDAKIITNKAEARVSGMTKSTSEEVTHILKVTGEDIKNVITGAVWLDSNMDGAKDKDEARMKDIKVRIYDVLTNDYLKDENGNIIEATTNESGEYTFTKITNGNYIILFEYNINDYETTTYLKAGVDDSRNSKGILKKITINGEEKTYAVTDTISLTDNITNINLGLKEKLKYDLELNKYISKISVQNSQGTKSYNYENSTFEKVEIAAKQLKGSVVVIEYSIKVKNTGEIAGIVNTIVDYLPNGLTFNSELNPNWYLSGDNLYTKALESETIKPNEEKEVKLILTKTMTENNVGLINNRAEIYEAYNSYGIADVDSIENNQINGEDDIGSADVYIGIKTGTTVILYVILAIINTGLIFIAIKLMIKNNIIKTRKGRG